jgi:hypothetical protein
MNPRDLKTQEKPVVLPKWEQIPKVQQQEMIQILSEMIRRQIEQEGSDEPQQDP